MGSTEPPSTTARTLARAETEVTLKECAMCGLPYDDGPHATGTAGCLGCDPTIRLRARNRTVRRHRRAAPMARVA